MKGLNLSALAVAAGLATAATSPCRVYISDPEARPYHNARQQSLSPVAARLVLAQRAGVETYHASDISREEVISGINEYGTWTPLFEEVRPSENIFYLVEADSGSTDLSTTLSKLTSFEISPAPETATFRDLLADLQTQKRHTPSHGQQERDEIKIVHATAAELKDAFGHTMSGKRVTVIVTQPSGDNSEAEVLWGTYEMPDADSQLQRRNAGLFEAPMELDPEESRTREQFTSLAKPAKNVTVAGILPACFSSQADCETRTRNCTGHGKCYLKYTDPDAAIINKRCYACQCSPVVEKNSRGSLTTVWGGPACQKKDVSFQFWLIALFSIGLVSLISFAVGTIWSMGEEELPSVIGAGVSGPVRR